MRNGKIPYVDLKFNGQFGKKQRSKPDSGQKHYGWPKDRSDL